MGKVSVIVPSRNERFLEPTVKDLISKARGDLEVIAVLDGYWPDPPLPAYSNLQIIHRSTPRGMRAAINAGAAVAQGEWLMKCDGHCMFDEGYDVKLQADIDKNWLAVPIRYSLDPEAWVVRPKAPVGYHYLDCPMTNPEYFQFHGVIWPEKDRQQAGGPEIDDLLSWQGSMWFMAKEHFDKRLQGMSEYGYGSFSQEPQEIGNKTWLGGGRLVLNKKTWYAHLHKGKQFGRGYHMDMPEVRAGHMYSAWYWMTNQWPQRIHDIEWLIDKFMPMPGWPANWRELLSTYQQTHPGEVMR